MSLEDVMEALLLIQATVPKDAMRNAVFPGRMVLEPRSLQMITSEGRRKGRVFYEMHRQGIAYAEIARMAGIGAQTVRMKARTHEYRLLHPRL